MENRPYSRLIPLLSTVSVKTLNSASRLILANNLDRKQILLSEKGFARDYRGFAELTGFPYRIIKKFEESEDRTLKILKAWETRPDATLDKLINNLEMMDRYDVIEDFVPSLREMFHTYIGYQNSLLENIRFPEGRDAYDAYVCYADEDSSIAGEIMQRLESPRIGLKLLKRGRDMLAECSNFELIKNKCRFMLVLLTANFIKSPALEFLVSFAGSLDIEQKQSTLITVILEHSEIPPVLNNMPMIDFSKEYKKVWRDLMWDSLILSLLPSTSAQPPNTIVRSAKKARNRNLNTMEIKNLAISFVKYFVKWYDTNDTFLNRSISFERNLSCKMFHHFVTSRISDDCSNAFDDSAAILFVY